MAWVRLDDSAMENLKIVRLSDAGLRVWLQGLCYCQAQLTDGFIPLEFVAQRRVKRSVVAQLETSLVDGKAPLWERVEGQGWRVHDYLAWNDSKEQILKKRQQSRERVTHYRQRVTPPPLPDSGVSGSGVSQDLEKRKPVSAVPRLAGQQRPVPGYRRLAVFPWMLDELIGVLGDHAESFDLDRFLLDLDTGGGVLPKQLWPWLREAVVADAQRRGLPMAGASASGTDLNAVRALLARDGILS